MEPENLTVRVLMDIREEMRGMRGDLSGLREDVSGLREDVNGLREDVNGLHEEQLRTNERLAVVETALVDIGGQLRFLGRASGVARVARRRHDERLDDLERRVTDLERQR